MKNTIPTLEEVKEYFKDANTFKSVFNGEVKIKTDNFKKLNGAYFYEDKKGYRHIIWNEDNGYAKILSYKEPKKETFSISKEQIKEMYDYCNSTELQNTVKEWFPEAFKTELTVGKWYKWIELGVTYLWHITKIKDKTIYCYGFSDDNWIEDGIGYSKKYYKEACRELKEATNQEVEEALIKEAVKRGFKEGVYYKAVGEEVGKEECFDDSKLRYRFGGHDSLCQLGKARIYYEGQWAEIIPTITKAEAEKELGKKIIN